MPNFFSLIVVVFSYHEVIEALECATPSKSTFRFFDNFEQFQRNKIPFSPLKDGWQGSNLEFTMSTIETLPKNVFVAQDSESIIVLKLSGKHIKEIETGAFMPLLCLEELFLDRNNVTALAKNIFPNRLRKLDLSHNQIEALGNSTFSNLPRLKGLNLASNRIKTVQVLAFINLTSLEYLNLEHNEMKAVPNDLFRPLPGLTTLILSWNKLGDLRADKWGDLAKLQNLELAGVDLNRFDPARVPFVNLKSVNLSSNSLTVLDIVVLKRHFPNLELIDLNNNPWSCDDLDRIIRELNSSNIRVPAGNFSHVGVYGIACREALKPPLIVQDVETTSITGTTASTSQTSRVCVDKDELERYVERKIKENNEELGSVITSVKTFTILTFSLLWIFVISEVLYRTSVCGMFGSRTKRNETSINDNNDVESFRLLHMKES